MINGVVQNSLTYSITGNSLVFTHAPFATFEGPLTDIEVVYLRTALDAITLNYTPPVTSLTDNLILKVIMVSGITNGTTSPTFSPSGITAKGIINVDGSSLTVGQLSGTFELRYSLGLDKWVILDTDSTFLQSGTGAVVRTLQDKMRESVSVKDDGALGDGTTSDTASFLSILTDHPTDEILIPVGTYLASGVSTSNAGIRGKSSSGSILKANAATNVLKLGWGTPNWRYGSISSLTVDGNSKASAGIQFGAGTSTEVSGRWTLSNIVIQNCSKGVYKPDGNIGNRFTACDFTGNDYGYYAVSHSSPDMHAGDDAFNSCHFDSSALAAIYIDSNILGAGGTAIRDSIIELNPGFGIFVNNWSTSYTPLIFDNVHFEGNHTSGSVTINSVSYTPVDLYLRNTARAVLTNGILPSIKLVNSHLSIDRSFISASVGVLDIDASSTVSADSCHFDGGQWRMLCTNVLRVAQPLGNNAQTFYVPPRTVKTFGKANFGTVIQSLSFADANSYAFTGTGALTATSQADGIIFDSCAELTIPAGPFTSLPSLVNFTSGKWYVITIDVNSVSGDLSKLTFQFNGGSAAGNISSLIGNQWATCAVVGQASSSFLAGLYITNSDTSASQVLRLSALQIIEFSTERNALEYLNSGVYIQAANRKRVIYSTSAPTTGVWNVGDSCVNIAPAVGQPKGWRCTVGGTPGTWVSEGNL